MKVAALALLLFAPTASADDAQDACMAQADRGQSLRDESKLIEAREQFLSCARDPCASVISKQCATWLQAVDAQMPTVAFRARGADGKDISLVRVLVDGRPRVESLDGHPIAINPGVHSFVYQHAGSPDVEDTVVIRAGEKNRPLDVRFATPAAAVERPPPRPEPKARAFRVPWLAAASLGAATGLFFTTGIIVASASSDAAYLRKTCAPDCPLSSVDGVRNLIAVANVTLVMAIAWLGVGALSLILANTSSSAPRKALLVDPVLHF